MPPARPRAVDDARSETSLTNAKDRVGSSMSTSKPKKPAYGTLNGASSLLKLVPPAIGIASASRSASGVPEEPPHVDWSSLPMSALHSYRSAYRLQIPSAYTKPHAELLYKSCDIALKAPSQCLARRKAHDLRLYRKQLAQNSNRRSQANGISKTSRASRAKEKENGVKRKDKGIETGASNIPTVSVEAPPSPTSHPSQHDSTSNQNTSDQASRKSPTGSTGTDRHEEEKEDIIPPSLNQSDPISTVIGSLPITNLATSIRTHFNAQQVNEAETVARFAYVVRQQGSSTMSRMRPLSQRVGMIPLPRTTAENIAAMAENASNAALNALVNVSSAAGPGTVVATGLSGGAADKGKASAHTTYCLSAPRLGGNHIEVEGSYGDGKGWIIGATSCGRQVRIVDGGGTGTFRLRFRPS